MVYVMREHRSDSSIDVNVHYRYAMLMPTRSPIPDKLYLSRPTWPDETDMMHKKIEQYDGVVLYRIRVTPKVR